MSNRRAQDERIEGTPDGSNAITEIVDVPDAPTIGTATASIGSASVPFTAATTGGTASTFTAISSPGSFTGTSATSPITVSGLAAGTSYSFTVRGTNSTGTGPYSSASNSVTPLDLPGSYDALADITVPSGGLASITFAGIPTDYKHLQIRILARDNRSSSTLNNTTFQINGDTGNNYSNHSLFGDGSSISVFGLASYPYSYGAIVASASASASVFGASIIDILDYADTNKNKTFRVLSGIDNNGSGSMRLYSGLWMSTSAITSITFDSESSGDFVEHSSFALYGVK
jgi:hypothetical protein